MKTDTDNICSVFSKHCTKCNQHKPLTEFYVYPKSKDGYRSVCKLCWAIDAKRYGQTEQGKKRRREAAVRHWKTDKYKVRNYRPYNITLSEYDEMFEKQEGNCAICGLPEITQRLAVDHNHKTGQIRELLCTHCNFVVGTVESDIMKKAIEYVNKHSLDRVNVE